MSYRFGMKRFTFKGTFDSLVTIASKGVTGFTTRVQSLFRLSFNSVSVNDTLGITLFGLLFSSASAISSFYSITIIYYLD